MIRKYHPPSDAAGVADLYGKSTLPEQCKPDLQDPIFLYTAVVIHNGRVVISSSLRGTAEFFLVVDHDAATPEQRWQWLQEVKDHMVQAAFRLGLDQLTAWIPPEIDDSFRKRLEELGFTRSPWQSYTLNV
jgi:hypothetical protein